MGEPVCSNRNMRPNQAVDDPEEFTCSISRIEAIDIASKPILASLRFNDLLRATMVWRQDEAQPGDVLATTPVLAAMSRATTPVGYFHPQASTTLLSESLGPTRRISGNKRRYAPFTTMAL